MSYPFFFLAPSIGHIVGAYQLFDVEGQEVLRVIVPFWHLQRCIAMEESWPKLHSVQQFPAHGENLMTSWMNDL